MRHLVSAILFLVLAASAQASYTVTTGNHTYNVDVTNANGQPIWGAWVNVNESGPSSAYVSVRAQGYKDAQGYVNVMQGQNYIYVRVRMEDPTVWVRVVDRAGATINAYVDQSQFMSNADEYRVEIRMPAQGFAKFQRQDVQTDMFGTYVNVYGAETARRVELRIPRRSFSMGWSQNVRVVIPNDTQLRQGQIFEALHGAE
jgi:hypothetical protein